MATQDTTETIALNGVYYGVVDNPSGKWRVGSLDAEWQEKLALFPDEPDREELEKLEGMDIYPAPVTNPKPLAVMCSGLGAAWPGMGRELYDIFPAARNAMDEIASLADWDVLGLLDETDSELINSSRYQIPYLFLLEYAQWRQLRWLGLQPDMVCGHSLGELVALCLAGIYPVEGAWLLLDTRARHMARLEKMGASETGMLAVSADRAKIDETLQKWPGLAISNANTPRQFVLGGPREQLLAARRELRRSHIPAFMLPINLAFHNPAMRILRDLSTRRLNTLEMHAPAIPMLSCVTAKFYPEGQAQTSRAIADLDENAVNWTKSVHAMRAKFGIGTFLELGPQDILCGLTRENDPNAHCIPTDVKNRESHAMRAACARLFAAGYLPANRLASLKAALSGASSERGAKPKKDKARGWKDLADIPGQELDLILDLLANVGNCKKEELHPDLDLKYDLGLRSSNFPLLLQEAEEKLGRILEIENIFNISTVGDLALFLAGKKPLAQSSRQQNTNMAFNAVFGPRLSILRWNGKAAFSNYKIDVDKKGPLRKVGGPILLLGQSGSLLNNLWEGLAMPGQVFGIPATLIDSCASLIKAGATIAPLEFNLNDEEGQWLGEISKFCGKYGALAGIFLETPSCALNDFEEGKDTALAEKLELAANKLPHKPWLCLLRIFTAPSVAFGEKNTRKKIGEYFERIKSLFAKYERLHCICWLDSRTGGEFQNRNEAGDLLALNLLYGQSPFMLWCCQPENESATSLFCLNPDGAFYEDSEQKVLPRPSAWQACLQYSLFASPELESHGPGAKPWGAQNESAASNGKDAWLPIGTIAAQILEAGNKPVPWLAPVTLQDFNLAWLPFLPKGITRECRLTTVARPWLIQNGHYVRLGKVEMSCRELTANGRRTNNWHNVADGLGAYAHAPIAPKPIWAAAKSLAPLDGGQLGEFYGKMNFGPCWQLLEQAWRNRAANILAFSLKPTPKRHGIAPKKDWSYSVLAMLVESLAQAAYFVAMEELRENAQAENAALEQWGLATIGYLQFDWAKLATAKQFLLEMRLAWQTAAMLRLDAQILADDGAISLVMTHMELEKRPDSNSASKT